MKKIVIIMLIIFIRTLSLAQEDNKRIYIQKIEGKSVDSNLLKRVRNIITATIIEKYGKKFYIINDEDIKIMYQQTEKLIISGQAGEENLENIAQSINSNIIIYGNVESIKNNQYTIILNKLENNKGHFKKSNMVTENFYLNEMTLVIPELAKKIVDEDYIINYKNNKTNNKAIIYNLPEFKIISNNKFINDLVDLFNNKIMEIDKIYDAKEYQDALEKYKITFDDINTKLTKNNQNEIKPIIDLVKGRMDSCNIQLIYKYNDEGDEEYYNMNFVEAFKIYKKTSLITTQIFNKMQKLSLEKVISSKIERTIKTGENNLYNFVKSKLDQSQYKNLQGDATYKSEIEEAYTSIKNTIFRTQTVIDLYNEYIELLKKNDVDDISLIKFEGSRYLINDNTCIDIKAQYNSYDIQTEQETEMSIIDKFDIENGKQVYIIEYSSMKDTPDNYSILFNGKIYQNKTKLNFKTTPHIFFNNYLIFCIAGENDNNYLFLNFQGKIVNSFNKFFEIGCWSADDKIFGIYTIMEIDDSNMKLTYYNFTFNKIKSHVFPADHYQKHWYSDDSENDHVTFKKFEFNN